MGGHSCPDLPSAWGEGKLEGGSQLGFPTPTPEYKKSFENDAQSSDNINFLKVQWSSRQLPTVRLQAGLGQWMRAQKGMRQNLGGGCLGGRLGLAVCTGAGQERIRTFALSRVIEPSCRLFIHLFHK